MNSLYNTKRNFEALNQILDELEGDITGQEGAFEELQNALKNEGLEAIDDMVAMIKNMEAIADARHKEAKRLSAEVKRLETAIGKMKGQIKHFLIDQGEKKVTTDRFTLSVVNNGGLAPLEVYVTPQELPDAFRVTVQYYEALNSEIRKAAEVNGGTLKDIMTGKLIAELKPRGQRLAIK